MDTMKDRNGTNLTEAEDIKKRWQEYTKLYKKDLNDPDNHDSVISHLEPDILDYKVKRVLGSITMNKASGGDIISAELLQTLRDDAVKVLPSMSGKFGKLSSSHRTGKVFSLQSQRRTMPTNIQTTAQFALISHASKVMLKILQARLQQYMN